MGSGGAVDGLSGDTLPAWGGGEERLQSSWHQFIEALGLRSAEEPAVADEAGVGPFLSSGKAAPGQALKFSLHAPGLKLDAGNTIVSVREAPEARADAPAGRKALGAGSKPRAQAHESRKLDGLKTTRPSGALGEPALGLGFQSIAVSSPDIAASRKALSMSGGVPGESFPSESRGARLGGPYMPVSSEEEMVKGSMMGPGKENTGTVSGDLLANATGTGFPNEQGTIAASEQEPVPEHTEARGNPGWQERGLDFSDHSQRGGTAHATTEGAIANGVPLASNHSQPVANASPPAEHDSAKHYHALTSARASELSPVRGAEKSAHARVVGESVGARGFSVIAAQDEGNSISFRDTAGVVEARGKQEGWVDQAPSPGKGLSGVSGEETFARLDEDMASRPIHWVQAGAHHAEAGYLDPALGWVGVRAENSGGGVHAAMLPGSPEAAQVLGSHLGGLNAFLSEQHGPHSTVTIATPQEGRYGAGTEPGNSAGEGRGRDDGAGQKGTRAGKESDSSVRTDAGAPRAVDTSMGSDGSAIRRAGTHVSVMA